MSIFNQSTPLEKTIRISFLLTILLHLLAAYFSEGHHKLDEYGGVFAYTGHGLGLWDTSYLNPGEYPAQIRPWIQPLIYMIPISPYTLLGGKNPFIINTLMRMISSLFALISLWQLIKNLDFFTNDKTKQRFILLGLTLFWFFPYFHARATAENMGMSFFILALCLVLKQRYLLLAGLFLAISFFMRFQMVVMIGSLVLWLFFVKKQNVLKLILGGLFGSCLMVALDSYFYGEFSFTPWNYWKFNIIEGVASSIGEDPWYFYFKKIFLKGIPPLSIFIFISTFWFWIKKPKNIITWLMIPFFIIHCLIGHKELRFLYPLSIFLPYIFAEWYMSLTEFKIPLLKTVLILNFILLPIASLKPAFSAIGLYHFLWDQKISEVRVLGDFPKPLTMYLRNQSLRINQIENVNNLNDWVFSNKYHYFQKIKETKKCQLEYLSYPEWLISLMPKKYRRRSKVFSLFYCSPSLSQ